MHPQEPRMVSPILPGSSNPLSPNSPVPPDRFVGRQAQLDLLVQLWTRQECPCPVLIHGGRRMGKTSLLNKAVDQLSSQITFVIVDCAPLATIPPTSNAIRQVARYLLQTMGRTIELSPILLESVDDTDTFYAALLEVAQVLRTRANRQRHILVFDNYDALCSTISSRRLPLNPFEILFQEMRGRPDLGFALVGRRPMFNRTPSPRSCIRAIEPELCLIQVDLLARSDVRTFFGNLRPDLLLYFETSARDAIFMETGGHPELMHRLGCLLVNKFNEGRARPDSRPYFTDQDVRSVLRQELSYRLQRLLKTYPPRQVAQMRALSAFLARQVNPSANPRRGPIAFQTIQNAFSASVEATRDTLDWLERLGFIVNPEENAWRIAYTSWIEWIQEWT